jgi:hypothetical protein
MGPGMTHKLRIGYWPLSNSLTSAGDRRRLVYWARARGHTVVTDLTRRVDVLVASENADFNSNFFESAKTPLIFDLVDGYLSPLNPIDDISRGVAKKISGQISGTVKPFSYHVKDFCKKANLVVCSSVEQETVIKLHNKNTQIILDSHDEIPLVIPSRNVDRLTSQNRILWEGQPATISGINLIALTLKGLSEKHELYFDLITDQKYFKVLNKYFQRDTLGLLEKNLHDIISKVNIVPWSVNALVNQAKESTLAMIPIDLSVPIQALKPENRLLIMWRLGLPCLTSASPAYSRVSISAGVDAVCESHEQWTEKFNQILTDRNFAYREVLKGQDYLREQHNQKILLHKWDTAIERALG